VTVQNGTFVSLSVSAYNCTSSQTPTSGGTSLLELSVLGTILFLVQSYIITTALNTHVLRD